MWLKSPWIIMSGLWCGSARRWTLSLCSRQREGQIWHRIDDILKFWFLLQFALERGEMLCFFPKTFTAYMYVSRNFLYGISQLTSYKRSRQIPHCFRLSWHHHNIWAHRLATFGTIVKIGTEMKMWTVSLCRNNDVLTLSDFICAGKNAMCEIRYNGNLRKQINVTWCTKPINTVAWELCFPNHHYDSIVPSKPDIYL